MIYNAGWENLIPQERKYTPTLAASAAKMIEAGESLTATARAYNISRASLHNWSTTDPTLKKAFFTIEANKLKAEQERERVRHFKAVAKDIVDNARNGVTDPVAQAVEKPPEATHAERGNGRADTGEKLETLAGERLDATL